MDNGDVARGGGRDVDVLHAPAAGADELELPSCLHEVCRDGAEVGEQDVGVSHLRVRLVGDLLGGGAVLLEVLGTVLELLAGGVGPLHGHDLSVRVERLSGLNQKVTGHDDVSDHDDLHCGQSPFRRAVAPADGLLEGPGEAYAAALGSGRLPVARNSR